MVAITAPAPAPTRRDGSARHYPELRHELTGALDTTLALVASTLAFPAVLLNVVGETTVTTLCSVGAAPDSAAPDGAAPDSAAPAQALPREVTLCELVATGDRALAVDHLGAVPAQRRPGMVRWQSYLGVPVHGREGHAIGALCVVDVGPRVITEAEVTQLGRLALVVEDQLDLARRRQERTRPGAVGAGAVAAALAAEQIRPWYQPVVDLRDGRVVGLEALARWEHPSLGVLTPEVFVPAAEDSDLVIQLDHAVLSRALGDLTTWRRTHPALRMSVNLSAKHLTAPGCVAALSAAAAAAGADPRWVDLEITETASVVLDATTATTLTQLREQGFRVLLDDFGTGMSVLEHLLQLPVDGVKIDRNITARLGTAKADAVVRCVVGLCQELQLSTVIEGVETPTVARRALALGCTDAQGYLWSPAVSAALVPRLLAVPSARPGGG